MEALPFIMIAIWLTLVLGYMTVRTLTLTGEGKEKTLPPSTKPNKYKTVAVLTFQMKFTDTREPYSFTYILKENELGERKYESTARSNSPNQSEYVKGLAKTASYIDYICNPWTEGVLSLDTIGKSYPKEATIYKNGDPPKNKESEELCLQSSD
jgi:hypothetical protein